MTDEGDLLGDISGAAGGTVCVGGLIIKAFISRISLSILDTFFSRVASFNSTGKELLSSEAGGGRHGCL